MLRTKINKLLDSVTLQQSLKSRQIELVQISEAKQTETTQSWPHIAPYFFFGFDVVGKSNIKIACLEKTFEMIQSIPSLRLRTLITTRLEKIIEMQHDDLG